MRRPSPPSRGRRRPPRSAARRRAWPASRSTASAKVRWSTFCTKEMTSPPSPQPKQCQTPERRADVERRATSRRGRGTAPSVEPAPADRRVTCSRTTSSIDVRSLTRATSSALIRPATGLLLWWPSLGRSAGQVPDDLPRRLGAGLAVTRPGVERHPLRVTIGRPLGRAGAR